MPSFFRFVSLVTAVLFLCTCDASPPSQDKGKNDKTSSTTPRPLPVSGTDDVLPLPEAFDVTWKKVTFEDGCSRELRTLPNATQGVVRGKIGYYWAFLPKAKTYNLPKDKNRKEYKFKFHFEFRTKKVVLSGGDKEVSIESGLVKETTDGDNVGVTARSSPTENLELRVVQLVGTLTFKDPRTQAEKTVWWWSAKCTPTFVAVKSSGK